MVGERVGREERESYELGNNRIGAAFFVNFALAFLLLQAMESTPIYRGWKRDMLSLMVPNLSR
jgi:hypothetical protein